MTNQPTMKWVSGQDPDNKLLVLTVPMKALEVTTAKGESYTNLAKVGTAFQGQVIGTDAKGNPIRLKLSVNLGSPEAENKSGASIKIG